MLEGAGREIRRAFFLRKVLAVNALADRLLYEYADYPLSPEELRAEIKKLAREYRVPMILDSGQATNEPVGSSIEFCAIAVPAMGGWVTVTVASKVIACTAKALLLDGSSGRGTFYIPREDVHMELLKRSTHITHDPCMGVGVYYDILAGGERSLDAAWSFEAPGQAIAAIKGYLAFAPNRVDAIIEWPSDLGGVH